MPAKFLKIGILVFWACMTAWLFMREPAFSVQPKEDLASLAKVASVDGPTWAGIYFVDPKSGKRVKIGYSKSQTIKTANGYLIDGESRMKINAQGNESQVRVISKILTNLEDKLLSIEFSMLSDSIKFEMFGRVDNGKLNLEIHTAAGTQNLSLDIPPNTVLPETLLAQAARKGMTVGQVIKMPFFDPTSFSFSDSEMTVIEKTNLPEAGGALVYHLRAGYKGIEMEAWIDSEGRTLREQAAGILTMAETQEQALTNGWDKSGAPSDLLEAVAVKTKTTMRDPRTASEVKLRLSGVDLGQFAFSDQRQELKDDVVTIKVEQMHPTTLRLPIEGPEWEKWLAATPTIQVRDPAVSSKSREIIGQEKDPLKAARALEEWVFKTIEKKPLVSSPSARDVLDIKRGDCNEHATLYTALARAAGIPTRIEVGLVYLKDGYYYHAWNAVYVGQWISIDPTFGQFPADAAHLKVLSGDLDAQIPIMNMIGKLGIDILEEK